MYEYLKGNNNSNHQQLSLFGRKALLNFLRGASQEKDKAKTISKAKKPNRLPTNLKSFQVNAYNMKATQKGSDFENDTKANWKFSEVSTEIENNTRFPLFDILSFYTCENSTKPLPKIVAKENPVVLTINDKINQANHNKKKSLCKKAIEKQKTIIEKDIKTEANILNIKCQKEKMTQLKTQRELMRNTKLKLHKLISNEPENYCTDFEAKIDTFNYNVFESMERTNYLSLAINKSKHFHFSNYHPHCYSIRKDDDIGGGDSNNITFRVMDLYKNKPPSTIAEKLTKELSPLEKKMIMNDPKYFWTNLNELKSHPLLIAKPLTEIITEEENKQYSPCTGNDNGESNSKNIDFNDVISMGNLTTGAVHHYNISKVNKKTLSFDKAINHPRLFYPTNHLTPIEKKIMEAKEALRKNVYHHRGQTLKEYQSVNKREDVSRMLMNMSHKILNLRRNKVIEYEKPSKPIKLMRREKKESLLISNYKRLRRIKRKQMITTEQSRDDNDEIKTNKALKNLLRLIKGNIVNKK